MHAVVLVIHLILALAIIGLVLLQRSEGGGLGIGGGGMGGLATPKGAANMLTRATAICAAAFFCTSLVLGILAGHESEARKNLLESIASEVPAAAEAPVDAGTQEEAPAQEETPTAPIAQ